MKRKKTRKTRRFQWLDHSSSSEWQTMAEIMKWVEATKSKPCSTTGRIIYEDEDVVVVSSETDGEGNFGNSTIIFKALLL